MLRILGLILLADGQFDGYLMREKPGLATPPAHQPRHLPQTLNRDNYLPGAAQGPQSASVLAELSSSSQVPPPPPVSVIAPDFPDCDVYQITSLINNIERSMFVFHEALNDLICDVDRLGFYHFYNKYKISDKT